MRKLLLTIFALTLTSTPTISVANYYGVIYNNKKSLLNFITTVDLGLIEPEISGSEPKIDSLKAKLKELNSKLNIANVEFINITSSSATVVGINGYHDRINITFTLRIIDLKLIIEDKVKIGVVKTRGQDLPTSQQVAEKIKSIYKINTDKIEITVNSDREAIIEGDGKVYQGTTSVSFVVDKTMRLDEVITNTYLGIIKVSPGQETPSKEKVSKKLLEFFTIKIEKIDINKITSSSAVIKSIDPKIYVGNPVTVSFVLDKKVAFDQILVNHDLGKININPNTKLPSIEEITIALKADGLNPKLNPKFIEVSEISEKQAKISSINQEIYVGNPIIVQYQITRSNNLKDIISDTSRNLGVIKIDPDKTLPTREDIIKVLEEYQYNLNFEKLDIKIVDATKAIVSSNDQRFYTGEVELTYTVDFSIDLDKVLTEKNLQTIDSNGSAQVTEAQIKKAIVNKNSNINLNYLKITKITEITALVIGDEIHYRGQVQVIFEVDSSKIIAQNWYKDSGDFPPTSADHEHLGSDGKVLSNWNNYESTWNKFVARFPVVTFSNDSIVSLFCNTYTDKRITGQDLTLKTEKINTNENNEFFNLEFYHDGGFFGAFINLKINIRIWHDNTNIYVRSFWKMETSKCYRNRVFNIVLNNASFHK